jgi:hypothetical protein
MYSMPRNVVTLVPKFRPWPGASRVQATVLSDMIRERRPDPHPHNEGRQVEFSFPHETPAAAAKAEIARLLDGIDPRWRRYFALYPRDQNT